MSTRRARAAVGAAVATVALVAGAMVSTAPAEAKPKPKPYPASVVTACKVTPVKAFVRKGKHPKVWVSVRSAVSKKPKGTVTVSFRGSKQSVAYRGHTVKVLLPKVHRLGSSSVTVTYRPSTHSIFRSCSAGATITVIRRR